MQKQIIKVEEHVKERVDKFLKGQFIEHSREYIKVLCKKGFVKVNNKIISSSDKIKFGDIIEIIFPQREDVYLNEQKDFETIFEERKKFEKNKFFKYFIK